MCTMARLRLSSLMTLLGAVFFLSANVMAASAVLGVDLGTEYIKAALVKPGMPLDIVLTKDSRRKETSAIAFKPTPGGIKEGDDPAAGGKGTPLRAPGAPPVPESEIQRENITTETIYNCIAAPDPEAIKQIMSTLLNTSDVTSCLNTINSIKRLQGLALADVITALAEELTKLDVNPEVMITWLEGLAEIEHRVAGGGNEVLQTGAVVGVVRSGVELMSR
ncbi:hypothetical protein NQ176_g4898 [Zarea fungicola]|uniref:Uncharacterized protein n=1 Tax=Zarea fungicola TaxID=93591 RepID=A0ACC1NDP4_9HYPO|nr:hypothetical protein NQ176_g4898 [Lecanicillium fungicola]